MHAPNFLVLLCTLLLIPALVHARQPHASNSSLTYRPLWKGSRRWIGPDWWASPLYDWRLKHGFLEAPLSHKRALTLLPIDVPSNNPFASFSIFLSIHLRPTPQLPGNGAAGLSIGRVARSQDYRANAVIPHTALDVVLRANGHLAVNGVLSRRAVNPRNPCRLSLFVRREGDLAVLSATIAQGNVLLNVTTRVAFQSVVGNVAITTFGPYKTYSQNYKAYARFSRFSMSGFGLQRLKHRAFGPILWTQYTLSGRVMRLQAQLAPINKKVFVQLWLKNAEGEWKKKATSQMDRLSRTARFEVHDWDVRSRTRYSVRMVWGGTTHQWGGVIREEPVDRRRMRLGVFSCDEGYAFPLNQAVAQVRRQDPDIVFFLGDQIYEAMGRQFGVAYFVGVRLSMLDFLRRWMRFGWTWRTVLRDRPSVILTDDHDVFQANLWGQRGRPLPRPHAMIHSKGGYVMPGPWVNAVERCYTGHLPTAAWNGTFQQGIKPYFTSIRYGGIMIAVLEDRKCKTGPLSMSEESREDGKRGDLLGKEQEAFVDRFVRTWPKGVKMKVGVSQTLFAKGSTHVGQDLLRSTFMLDSGGWPKEARDRALQKLGKRVLMLHGDQHVGMVARQGIREFDDGGVAFMVPGTANGFPRAWWPGLSGRRPNGTERFTGRFTDDGGNLLNVLAVGNPDPLSTNLDEEDLSPMEKALRKGSGYGLVVLDKQSKTATMHLYRVGLSDTQFDGFPVRAAIGGPPQ